MIASVRTTAEFLIANSNKSENRNVKVTSFIHVIGFSDLVGLWVIKIKPL